MKVNKQGLGKTIKIIFSCLFLIIVLRQLSSISIQAVISKLVWQVFSISALLFLFRNILGAWRWKVILKKNNQKVTILVLLKYYFIGNFFGFFLPTAIGGDVARAYYLSKDIGSIEISTSTVILERVLGIFAIFILFLFSVLMGVQEIMGFPLHWFIVVLLIVIVLMICLAFYFPLSFIEKILIFPLSRFKEPVIKIVVELQSYRKNIKQLLFAVLISILFQMVMIFCFYLLSKSANMNIPFYYFLLFIPFVWVISLLPISLNGLGVRESSFVYLFSSVGYPSDLLSVVSILSLFLLVIQGMIGGVLYLLNRENLLPISNKNSK